MKVIRGLFGCGAIVAIILIAVSWRSNGQNKAFRVPNTAERVAAIGETKGLSATERRAYFADPVYFEPIDKPGASDWLANHEEPGQTFSEFLHSRKNRPDKARNIIYLQPIGKFDEDAPSLDALKEYSKAYFQMEVKMLKPIESAKLEATRRINRGTGKEQILAGDVMNAMRKRLPKDAYCMLAITMIDLYPQESWNFVFGMASLRDRVGVFGFARYDPEFYGDRRDEDFVQVIFQRSAKVLVHETGHMFGIQHCVHFNCIMNGSNHLEETDARPMHLCPVCLRKLQNSTQLDPVKRYQQLGRFYKRNKLDPEADWIEGRLEQIGNGG